MMEHYEKLETRTSQAEDDRFQVPGTMADSVVNMKVNTGSKIRNLVDYAKRRIKEQGVKQIVWTATGKAASKAISCAEIFKRLVEPNFRLHQITKLSFRRFEEIWQPKMEGLDVLKVNVDIPVIKILLSKEPLDPNEPGYQPPGPYDVYWRGKIEEDKRNEKRKQKPKQGDKSSLGKPEVNFQKKQKSHQDSNTSGGGKKERKQRKNEKRRASGEGQTDNRDRRDNGGSEKNRNKAAKRTVGAPQGSEQSPISEDLNVQGGDQAEEAMES